jgi:diaminopropionate ammonia-lyase
MPLLFNPRAGRVGSAGEGCAGPLDFHRRLPGYEPTPLVELPALAEELGLGRVLVKDESARLGLPAFKILGASWAVYRELADRLDQEPGDWSSVDDLAARFAPLRPLELLAATDGNHGRAVARVARWLGLGSKIFVPRGTVSDRIRAIESEGAEVIVVPGSYDETVGRAAAARAERSLLVQDTGWPGYERIPRRVIEGYATMFEEIDRQGEERGIGRPDLVLVQVGVGALAAAVIRHYRKEGGRGRTRIVGVEPADAACAAASIERGRPVTVPGPHRSMMAGLNCGTISSVAWPWLEQGLDAVVTLGDERAGEAMRRLAGRGLASGESGAAGLAGLLEIGHGPRSTEARERLGLDGESRVLLFSTEGITDADNYSRVVGRAR